MTTPTTITDRRPAVLASGLTLGPVTIVATDLDRSVAFYESVIGLHVRRRTDASVTLGVGDGDVVTLTYEPGARPAARDAGLYHVALLYPTREELAQSLRRIAEGAVRIDGASNHHTHEAIYLSDPAGNGLELAADFPKSQWPSYEALGKGGGRPEPLDVSGLLALVTGGPLSARATDGLRVGHLHLHVGDVDQALDFYANTLGFEVQMHLGSAAFVSAGGYHHHLGLNVWRGKGVAPQPADAVGLRDWQIVLPTHADVAEARERLVLRGHEVRALESGDGFQTFDPWRIPLTVIAKAARADSAVASRR